MDRKEIIEQVQAIKINTEDSIDSAYLGEILKREENLNNECKKLIQELKDFKRLRCKGYDDLSMKLKEETAGANHHAKQIANGRKCHSCGIALSNDCENCQRLWSS